MALLLPSGGALLWHFKRADVRSLAGTTDTLRGIPGTRLALWMSFAGRRLRPAGRFAMCACCSLVRIFLFLGVFERHFGPASICLLGGMMLEGNIEGILS